MYTVFDTKTGELKQMHSPEQLATEIKDLPKNKSIVIKSWRRMDLTQ